MSLWDTLSGRLAHYRRERSGVSETVYRQIVPFYKLLMVNCGDDERIAITIRNYVASVFQSIEACTAEDYLKGPFLQPVSQTLLSFSRFDWRLFFSCTHFQNAVLNFADAPSDFRVSLLTNVFTGICTVYQVEEQACTPWFGVCELIADPSLKPIERQLMAVRLWHDNLRRLLGSPDLSREAAIRWITFQGTVDKCAKSIVADESFEPSLHRLIQVYSA